MAERKVILVTGASSGIGRACADRLHADGHVVYGTSRRPHAVAAPWRVLALDVTDEGSVAACVGAILMQHGRIDGLINNAGMVLAGAVEDTSPEEALRQLDTNVVGALRLCRAVLPAMRAQGDGLILNVGSLAGRVALPFQGLYSASKAALAALTEALRLEVAPFGIRVAVVEPGDIATRVVQNRVQTAGSGASAYAAFFKAALAIFERDETAGAPPAIVAARVAQLVASWRVRQRYMVGGFGQRALVALKPYVPGAIFEAGVAKTYGLSIRKRSRPS